MLQEKFGVDITAQAQDYGSGLVAYMFTDHETLTNKDKWIEIPVTNDLITQKTHVENNGPVYFFAKDKAGNINSIMIDVNNIKPENVKYTTNSKTNPYWEWTCTTNGKYIITIVAPGASGSYTDYNNAGARGGIVQLEVYVYRGAKLYAVIGSKGTVTGPRWVPGTGGYNGGGNGGRSVTTYRHGYNDGGGNLNERTAGIGGSGAATVASGLMGTGLLINYQNTSVAGNYMLGVAGGAGGAPDYWCLSRFGKDNNSVNGGAANAGQSGQFALGMNAKNYDIYRWVEYRDSVAYQDSTEGPSGGGGGWKGGWANNTEPRYRNGHWDQAEWCKTGGQGGSNYAAGVGRQFTTNGKTVTINRIVSNGTSGNYGDGYVTINWVEGQ